MNQRLDKDGELFIDAIRGIAALMVVFCHAFELGMSEIYGWDPDKTPGMWRFARASLGNGDFWVWCFFVISGLCIHRSIARGIAEGRFSWGRYALARVTRIYPLFLIGLMLAVLAWTLGLEFASDEPSEEMPWIQLAASLMNLQLLTAPFPNFGPSWSITCEVVYYAAWPLALILMRGQVTRAAMGTLFVNMAGVGSIFFIWHGLHMLETSTALNGLWMICILFPAWLSGAWLGGNWEAVSPMVTKRKWQASVMLCGAVLVLEWVLRFKHYPGWARHFTSWGAVPGLLFALAGARHVRLSSRTWAQPVCRWLGQISYPCYILHMPLLMLVNHAVDAALPRFALDHRILLTSLETVLVLLLLAFIGPPLERYFMAWRARLLAGSYMSLSAKA